MFKGLTFENEDINTGIETESDYYYTIFIKYSKLCSPTIKNNNNNSNLELFKKITFYVRKIDN